LQKQNAKGIQQFHIKKIPQQVQQSVKLFLFQGKVKWQCLLHIYWPWGTKTSEDDNDNDTAASCHTCGPSTV